MKKKLKKRIVKKKNKSLSTAIIIGLVLILAYFVFVNNFRRLEVTVNELPGPPWATTIYGCQELNESGAYYVLNHSFVSFGDCFSITAANITLDGNGNGIQGNDSGIGVQTNQPNIVIKNLAVLHFDVGVYLQEGSINSSLENNNIVYNDLQDVYDSYALSVQIRTDKDDYYSGEQVNLTDASQI